MMFKFTLLAVILCTSSICAYLSHGDREFVQKYQVDPEVAAILDQHNKELSHALEKAYSHGRTMHTTWTFAWLPGYIVKLNIARIYGMEKMKRCIERHNLDCFILPDKRLYHLKNRPDDLSSKNYLVVVKKVETDPARQPLTLRHVQQLITLMQETGYISVTAANYIRTYNHKIAMIDTESNFDYKQLLSGGYTRLLNSGHDISRDYTEDALKYLLSEIAKELRKARGRDYKSLLHEIRGYLRKARASHWDYTAYLESELGLKKTVYRNALDHKSLTKVKVKRNKFINYASLYGVRFNWTQPILPS